MKKYFLLLLILGITTNSNAQAKGAKIGYIDMDYILENVPNYKEASTQLEQKAQKWKQDIEVKKNEINKLKEALKSEKALLTKELATEREEEIKFQESDLIDYQQKRFGATGDYMIQKTAIAKPVQDQVFTAVQDIAEARGYDFILDKSSDLTMLFSRKSFDISDRVVRVITQSEKREQVSKKQLKALEEKEEEKEKIDANPAMADRAKILAEKRAVHNKLIEEQKENALLRKKEKEALNKKIVSEKTEAKNNTKVDTVVTKKVAPNLMKMEAKKIALDSIKKSKEIARLIALEINKKKLEDNKKAIEDKKKQIAAEKEAGKNKK